VGVTGLALLAFAGAGLTHARGMYRSTVGKGLDWLRANQKPDGHFPWHSFDEQGIAALALCEFYGLTADRNLRVMAKRAIDYIVSVQPEHGGFGRQGAVPKEEGDMLVTGWQILAMKSAMLVELDVLPRAIERSLVFLKNTNRGNVASADRVGSKDVSPTATAIGTACRALLNHDDEYDIEIVAGAKWLLEYEKRVGSAGQGQHRLAGDLSYSYFGALAMCEVQGDYWRQWREFSWDPLERAQSQAAVDDTGRPIRGSWNPAIDCRGKEGGRVYTTAMAILVLEIWPRFPRLYRKYE
jgi:prenyltransferase beta subunit